jgi:hypothetical protein
MMHHFEPKHLASVDGMCRFDYAAVGCAAVDLLQNNAWQQPSSQCSSKGPARAYGWKLIRVSNQQQWCAVDAAVAAGTASVTARTCQCQC